MPVSDAPTLEPLYAQLEAELGLSVVKGFLPRDRPELVSQKLYSPQDLQVMPMPVKEYTLYGFYAEIADVLPLVFVMAFLLPVSSVLTALVAEKETKMKEVMKMYRVIDAMLVLSWLITFVAQYIMIALLTTACSTLELFPNTGFFLLIMFYFLFLMDILAFCFMISMFFDNARTASVSGMSLWLTGFFRQLCSFEFDIQRESRCILVGSHCFH